MMRMKMMKRRRRRRRKEKDQTHENMMRGGARHYLHVHVGIEVNGEAFLPFLCVMLTADTLARGVLCHALCNTPPYSM